MSDREKKIAEIRFVIDNYPENDLKPEFSEQEVKAFELLGRNKIEWLRFLLSELDRIQQEYAEERAAHNEHVTELCRLEEDNRKRFVIIAELVSERKRLRAENERYRKALERIAEIDIPYAPMTDHSVIRFYEQVAREALASTPTEPSGAELVKCVICKTVAYPNGRWKKAHYGDVCPDCRSGRRIKAPEKVGTEERRHKYFGAEWPEAEGDGNDA